MSSTKTKEGKSRGGKNSKNTNEEVQRAIDGLNEIPDDEFQEFLDDEDFIDGLDVVDAWEGDEDGFEEPQTTRERDHRRNSRERNHRGRRGGPENRSRGGKKRREDRKRDDRRDPSKSSKDIERDKLRTRRDNESKVLAEKEKAIKHLLDSDTVVPPGTEVEAIETELHRRSRDHRDSRDRSRFQEMSPIRRRSPRVHEKNSFHQTPERRRRSSWDRRNSLERRERHSRRRVEDRELRLLNRRSRSRVRSRSPRRRWSRSPRTSRRRSPTKTPERRRKRSPFLHEIARQLNHHDALLSEKLNHGFVQQQQQQPAMMQPINISNQLPQQHHYGGHSETYAMPFVENQPQPVPMNFEQIPIHQHVDYNPGASLLFNPPNPMIPDRQIFQSGMINQVPQPVPAPVVSEPKIFIGNNQIGAPKSSPNQGEMGNEGRGYKPAVYNGAKSTSKRSRAERIRTPEPPVISEKKVEKTSLSSLLEATVTAKGFKPEILRQCDQALRELPDEDPRLRMKGRFFFDPKLDEPEGQKVPEFLSNSILLQQKKVFNIWSPDDKKIEQPTKFQIETHQKYCQTEIDYNDKSTQTFIEKVDFCVQVCPGDLTIEPPISREEKRPIMDRLDWNLRDKHDYVQAADDDDLRWSLSSSQKRKWSRTISPELDDIDSSDSPSRNDEAQIDRRDEASPRDRYRENSRPRSRGFVESPYGSRHESYSHRNDRFSPEFRRDVGLRDCYDDNRSRHSRDRSPDINEDDPAMIDDDVFSRESNWRERPSSKKFSKPRGSARGKSSGGRNFRGRGRNYRGGKY